MKMKKFWKKFIAKVLTAVMLASVFSTVDMGWNVREVQAEDLVEEFTEEDWKTGSYKEGNPLKKTYTQVTGNIYNSSFDGNGFFFGMGGSITVSTTSEGASAGYEIKKVELSNKDGGLAVDGDYKNLNKWSITSGKISSPDLNNTMVGFFRSFTVSDVYAPSVTIKFADRDASRRICYTDMKVYYGLHACRAETVTRNVAAKNATCTTDGWKAYSVCYCGKVYAQGNFSTSYSNENAWKTSNTGKNPKLGHSFGYTGSGNIITAKCSRDQTHTATLTLTANGGTYDGTPKPATVSNWSSSTLSGLAQRPTITYTNQAGTATDNSNTAPTNVGNYTASITVDGAKAIKNFSITKKNVAADDLAVSCGDSVYDGQAKSAQVSVASGKDGLGDDITVKYQKQNGTGWDEATTDKPVNAGTYKVLVSTTEGNNFNATSSDLTNDTWKFTISKRSITINPDAGQEKNFGEDDPVFTYNYDQSEFIGSDYENITGAMGRESGEDVKSGDYAYLIDTLSAGNNYELTIPANAPKFVIHKLTSIDPPAPGEGYILDYDKEELKAEPDTEFEIGKIGEGGEFISISVPENLEPGDTEQTYYVRYKDNENHPESGWTPITIAPRPAAPAESEVTEYTDESITLKAIPGVEYSINGGITWITGTDGEVTFNNLIPETPYTIKSRVKATNKAPHGHETEQTVTTKKAFPKSDDDRKGLFKYTPPAENDLIYNKEAKEAGVELREGTDPDIGKPVVKYYKIVDDEEVEVEKPTDAGKYIVKVTTLPTDDYPALPETVLGEFTIAQREIKISGVKAKDKEYDGTDVVEFDYNYVVYAGIIEGDQLSVTATGNFNGANVETGKPVTINLNGYTLGGNDVANYVLADSGHQSESSADIIPREVVLSWEYQDIDFDTNSHLPGATAINLVSDEECNVTVELVGAIEAINAGNYTANAIGLTGANSDNYKLSTDTTKTAKAFTINKIKQTGITLNMVGEYNYMDGTISGPSVSGCEEHPTILYYYSLKDQNTGGTLLKSVGPMALEPDTYYLYAVLGTTTNYKEYTTDPVLFRVKGQDMSDDVIVDYTDAASKTVTYTYTGKKEHGIKVKAPAGAKIMYGTTEGNYTLSTCPTYKDVGEYPIFYKVTMTGCDPVADYAKVTITQASLYVTPSPQTKVYGEDDPVFTYTVEGLLGTDTASVVSGTIGRASGEDVVADGYAFFVDDLTAKNYTVQCKSDVVFEITPKTLTSDMVALKTWKYKHTGSSINVGSSDNITLTYKNVKRTLGTDYRINDGNTAIDEGNYKVTIEGIGNFKGTIEKDWIITTKEIVPVSVSTPNDVIEVIYGDEISADIIIDGLNTALDTVTYGKTEDDITDNSIDVEFYKKKGVGTYNIYFKVDRKEDGKEYEPFESYVQLVIVPKPVGITWGDTNLIYNGKKQAPTAAVNAGDLIGTDACEVVTSSDAKNVGNNYTATATGLTNKNYEIKSSAEITKTFEIKPKPITVKAKNVSKYVNTADPELTYEAAGLCEGDTLSGITLTRDEGESVGTYSIVVHVGNGANPNYAITPQNGEFKISNRPSSNSNPKGDGPDGSDDSEGSDPSSPWTPLPKNEKPAEEKKPSDGLPKQIVKDNTKKDGDKKEIDKDLNSSDKPDDGKDTNGDDGLKKYEDVKDEPVVENDKIKYGDGNISIVIDGDNQPGAGGDKPGTPEGALNVNVKSLEELIDTVLTDEEKERVKNGEEVTIRIFGEEKIPSEEAKTAVEECIKNGKIPFDLEDGTTVEVGMNYGKTMNIKVMKKLGNGEEVEVTDWNGKMTVTVDIPADLIADGRNYYIIAYVNGEAKRIPATVNADGTITFEAEAHVEYAICYIDEKEIPLSRLELHNGKHNLLWLYLVLLLLFFALRKKTEEKKKNVKRTLVVGDAVIAGLLLFVVKICLLSVIVCLAEIGIALAIHMKIKGKEND